MRDFWDVKSPGQKRPEFDLSKAGMMLWQVPASTIHGSVVA